MKKLKKSNIGCLAITDHDNIDGAKELVRLPHDGLEVYSGVELTAKVEQGRMHILGYNIDLDNEDINKALRDQQQASIFNLLLYIELLKKDFNLEIPTYEIDKIIKAKGNIGRPHLASLLVKLGYAKDVEEAFKKYLIYVYERVRKVKRGLTKEECIELINGASGVAVLAHPNSLKLQLQELREEISYLKLVGLQGLETIHSNLSLQERKAYHQIAVEKHLLESGGTDFHGYIVKPDIKLGTGRDWNVAIPMNGLSLTRKVKSRY